MAFPQHNPLKKKNGAFPSNDSRSHLAVDIKGHQRGGFCIVFSRVIHLTSLRLSFAYVSFNGRAQRIQESSHRSTRCDTSTIFNLLQFRLRLVYKYRTRSIESRPSGNVGNHVRIANAIQNFGSSLFPSFD